MRKKRFDIIFIVPILFFLAFYTHSQQKESELINRELEFVAGLLKSDQIEYALVILNKLNSVFPENYDVVLYKRIAFCLKQDYESAHKEFHKIERAIELEERMGAPRPLKDSRYEPKVSLESQPLHKTKIAFSPKNRGLYHFYRGITSLKHKVNFKEASKQFRSAIKEGCDKKEARYLLIYSLITLRDYYNANQELNKLLATKEMDETDYFIKGYFDYQRRLEKEAISSFEKAIEIYPDFIEAKRNLACIHYNKARWETAIEIWEAILEKMPNDFESQVNITRAYFHLGKKEEAKKQAERLKIKLPISTSSPRRIALVFIPIEKLLDFDLY